MMRGIKFIGQVFAHVLPRPPTREEVEHSGGAVDEMAPAAQARPAAASPTAGMEEALKPPSERTTAKATANVISKLPSSSAKSSAGTESSGAQFSTLVERCSEDATLLPEVLMAVLARNTPADLEFVHRQLGVGPHTIISHTPDGREITLLEKVCTFGQLDLLGTMMTWPLKSQEAKATLARAPLLEALANVLQDDRAVHLNEELIVVYVQFIAALGPSLNSEQGQKLLGLAIQNMQLDVVKLLRKCGVQIAPEAFSEAISRSLQRYFDASRYWHQYPQFGTYLEFFCDRHAGFLASLERSLTLKVLEYGLHHGYLSVARSAATAIGACSQSEAEQLWRAVCIANDSAAAAFLKKNNIPPPGNLEGLAVQFDAYRICPNIDRLPQFDAEQSRSGVAYGSTKRVKSQYMSDQTQYVAMTERAVAMLDLRMRENPEQSFSSVWEATAQMRFAIACRLRQPFYLRFGQERTDTLHTNLSPYPHSAQRAANFLKHKTEHTFTWTMPDGSEIPLTTLKRHSAEGLIWDHAPPASIQALWPELERLYAAAKSPLRTDLKEKLAIQEKVEQVARLHWLVAQLAPCSRGSAAIGEIVVAGLFKTHGIAVGACTEDEGRDTVSLTMGIDAFVAAYPSLYDRPMKRVRRALW